MPHKQKATMETKVRIARACIAGKMSKSDASREAGVNCGLRRRVATGAFASGHPALSVASYESATFLSIMPL